MARKKYEHPEVWVLALDTWKKTLIGAAEFCTESEPGLVSEITYCPSAIAKYIEPDPRAVQRRRLLKIFNDARKQR
jgi:hypothetical protein